MYKEKRSKTQNANICVLSAFRVQRYKVIPQPPVVGYRQGLSCHKNKFSEKNK